jgi:threonine/homoserine/homoserine lactone efflux protein
MLAFLFSAVAISLSGVMAPGPITVATLAAGARRRHAGAMIALGHVFVELPLIILLVAGVASFLESMAVRTAIGVAGGAVLVLMGLQLLLSARRQTTDTAAPVQRHPLLTGIVLSVANPYFLVWWATVGLALVTQAWQWGVATLVLFALVHWLCDLGWLEVLSTAGFKGSEAFGRRAQIGVSLVCGVVLLAFGIKFLVDAGVGMQML